MNVTPSKILLGLSLAGFAYCSWDHLFPDKAATTTPKKITAVTAAVVNRTFTLKLDRDPFNSVPMGQLLGDAEVAGDGSGKDLGDVHLQGVMITFAERAAVINGKTLHEGESMKTAGGTTIRAKRISVGSCIVESGGHQILLKVDDAPGGSGTAAAPAGPAIASAGRNQNTPAHAGRNANRNVVAGVNPGER